MDIGHTPAVTVLMPAYNAAAYLRPAVESILQQTFTDFEFLIIDDGSTDDTAKIIAEYSDSRIRFLRQSNQRLARTLNTGIGMARGAFVARQDADDVSLPERLGRQIEFLRNRPEIAMVGTAAEIWVEDRPGDGRFHRHPCEPVELAFAMLFDNYFVHSSIMIRRAVLEGVGGYCSDRARQPEDFELWSRVVRKYAVANLPEVLQIYRERAGSICRSDDFQESCTRIAAENIAYALGSAEPAAAHLSLACYMRGQRPVDRRIPLHDLRQMLCDTAAAVCQRFSLPESRLSEALVRRTEMLKHQYERFHLGLRAANYARRRVHRVAGWLRPRKADALPAPSAPRMPDAKSQN